MTEAIATGQSVYVLIDSDYRDRWVVGVYATHADALKADEDYFNRTHHRDMPYSRDLVGVEIEEWEVETWAS